MSRSGSSPPSRGSSASRWPRSTQVVPSEVTTRATTAVAVTTYATSAVSSASAARSSSSVTGSATSPEPWCCQARSRTRCRSSASRSGDVRRRPRGPRRSRAARRGRRPARRPRGAHRLHPAGQHPGPLRPLEEHRGPARLDRQRQPAHAEPASRGRRPPVCRSRRPEGALPRVQVGEPGPQVLERVGRPPLGGGQLGADVAVEQPYGDRRRPRDAAAAQAARAPRRGRRAGCRTRPRPARASAASQRSPCSRELVGQDAPRRASAGPCRPGSTSAREQRGVGAHLPGTRTGAPNRRRRARAATPPRRVRVVSTRLRASASSASPRRWYSRRGRTLGRRRERRRVRSRRPAAISTSARSCSAIAVITGLGARRPGYAVARSRSARHQVPARKRV